MFSFNFTLLFINVVLFGYKFLVVDPTPPSPHDVPTHGFRQKTLFPTYGNRLSLFAQSLNTCRLCARSKSVSPSRQKLVLIYLASLLLEQSYAPEPNPGPIDTHNGSSQFPCGTCDVAVSWSEKGIECETCGQWFHARCQSINTSSYEHLADSDLNMPWHCAICGNPNSQTFFDQHDVDSLSLPQLTENMTPTKLHLKPLHASTPTRACQQNKRRERPLRVVNINFQSAVSKKVELSNLISSTKPDIIIGTETWLDGSITDGSLFGQDLNTYKIYRKDRNRSGGGVLIAICSNLESFPANEISTDCEILWVKLKVVGRRSLYIGAFYRPNAADEASLLKLEESLSRVVSLPTSHLLIGGDFNLPSWDWSTMSLKQNPVYPSLHHHFMDMLTDFGLEQMNRQSTRGDNILDLYLTNCPDLVSRTETIPGLSDHDIVYCEVNITSQKRQQCQRQIPIYNKGNWDEMKKTMVNLKTQMEGLQESATTEELWSMFKTTLQNTIKKNIPHKTSRTKAHKPWITPELLKLIKRRDRIYKKMKKSGTEELKTEARNLKRLVQRKLRQSYWSFLSNTFAGDDDAPQPMKNKRFWSYIKHQRSSGAGVSPLKQDGRLTSDPKAQAELLNAQFQAVFSEGKTYTQEEFHQKTGLSNMDYPALDSFEITEAGVQKLLKNLNIHKASGPDTISSRVLKDLADEVAPLLTIIYQSSMYTGKVPTDWRDAFVTPIFKKGERHDPANYRPVSLTCISCKILEHIVVSHVMNHLEGNQILCDQQHGFRRGRSCETQLLEFVDELIGLMEEGKQTDVLIMDFAKAFDKVNHSLLLHKLTCYGVQGAVNRWIGSFLRDRRQAVVVDGTYSSYASVRSGVPQGSVLGPCLFLTYINDLPEKLTSPARLFADDTAVYNVVANAQDHSQLQEDLNRLAEWESSWDMEFHPGKCTVLPVTRSRKPSHNEYQLHGHTLTTVTSAKYLGVTIHKDLTWDEHISNICSKANQTLGFLRRNLKISHPAIKEKAYKALVRPLLEYAATVWDPSTQKHIDRIEGIQRRGARFVLNRYHRDSSVQPLLDRLKWPPLAQRRKTARVAMLFKIKNGLVQTSRLRAQLTPLPPRVRRGHDQQLTLIPCRTKYRQSSFLPRTLRDWNSLPAVLPVLCTLDTFVDRVSRFLCQQ